jgi:RNA polymerase sigma-70 factor (ECF subfamily)
MDDEVFVQLMARARGGDEAAVGELLRHYEEDVRLMVRVRLPRALRSQFDSMDFVQAVWQSFFSDDPGRFANSRHLRGFLAGVVRNKVHEEYRRRTRTRKYDMGREESLYVRRGGRDEPREVAAPDPSPSQNAQAADRWDQLLAGRSELEARVVELRRQGLTFDEIAEQTGLSERSARRIIDAIRERLEARRWQ